MKRAKRAGLVVRVGLDLAWAAGVAVALASLLLGGCATSSGGRPCTTWNAAKSAACAICALPSCGEPAEVGADDGEGGEVLAEPPCDVSDAAAGDVSRLEVGAEPDLAAWQSHAAALSEIAARLNHQQPWGRCGTWTGRRPIRALFVGNSQIGAYGLDEVVSRLSESAPAGCPRIESSRFLRGGANLGTLWRDGADDGRLLADELVPGRYDVVVLTESIDLADVPGFAATFDADARVIVDAVRLAGALPVFFATGYPETPTNFGFVEMATPQFALGAELGVPVAAGGLAWLRAWAERPAADLFDADRAHPGYRGIYLSALVVHATITGASTFGLTGDTGSWCPSLGAACPPVEPDLVGVFQAAAWAQHQVGGVS